MRKILFTICIVSVCLIAQSQPLKFRKDGTFKIVQLTDVHFKHGAKESEVSLSLFNEIIQNEKPDLVVFTGDIVVEPAPVANGWQQVLKPFAEAKIPVIVTLGNHDHEHDLKRNQVYKLLSEQNLCYSNPKDFTVEIKGNNNKTAALLYIFDSNAYSTNKNVDGYGWITNEQVNKYIATCKRYTKANKGEPLPALAYFHIPLPEYNQAYNNIVMPAIGNRGENECSPKINTGMFAAMVNTGDVMGCFVGHDHVNDYIAYQNNIALAYGRVSSEGTTYGNLRAGSRIVILKEGKRSFKSYIYERGGKITQNSSFPRKLRFAITADTHFDMPPETDQWVNVVELNKHNLDGVAIVGDIFDHQHADILNLFRRRYENCGIDGDSTINTQVYLGLGNHDINPVSNDAKQNLIEQTITLNYVDSVLMSLKQQGKILNLHAPTRNYSFNLNGLHFIQTNTWAGDTTLGKGGLEWLAADLKRYASNNEPVVLLMHYTFNPKSMRWINQEQRNSLAQTIKGYNIMAIFNGHDHYAQKTKWNNIDVYQADNAWIDNKDTKPSFWIINYTPNSDFVVEQKFWEF